MYGTVFELIRKMPVGIDRFIILAMLGSIRCENIILKDVGIGSKSQLVSGNCERSLATPSVIQW